MPGTRDMIDSMAPWDAAPYFQAPKESSGSFGGGAPVLLVPADPMRVALVMSSSSAGGATVTTNANAANGQGISLGSNAPPVVLLFAEVGPLVQMAWYANSSFAVQFTFITVSLAKWPDVRKMAKEVQRAANPKPTDRGSQRGGLPVNRRKPQA